MRRARGDLVVRTPEDLGDAQRPMLGGAALRIVNDFAGEQLGAPAVKVLRLRQTGQGIERALVDALF